MKIKGKKIKDKTQTNKKQTNKQTTEQQTNKKPQFDSNEYLFHLSCCIRATKYQNLSIAKHNIFRKKIFSTKYETRIA